MTESSTPQDDAERLRYLALLEACAAAQASESWDEGALAGELELSEEDLDSELDDLDSFGFIAFGEDPEASPTLRRAGRQFLERDGRIPRWQRHFLGRTLDDLDAREALLRAGSTVVDGFREQLLLGHGADYASLRIVPPAFSPAVGERVALDLYAAAVALMARLSGDEPAGCVAEEVVAVRVIAEARAWLGSREADGELDHDAVQTAAEELNQLFALFQDDEVLDLFDMEEPADAALALHDADPQQLGVVDQRFQSWFAPFGWTAPTGYLQRP